MCKLRTNFVLPSNCSVSSFCYANTQFLFYVLYQLLLDVDRGTTPSGNDEWIQLWLPRSIWHWLHYSYSGTFENGQKRGHSDLQFLNPSCWKAEGSGADGFNWYKCISCIVLTAKGKKFVLPISSRRQQLSDESKCPKNAVVPAP